MYWNCVALFSVCAREIRSYGSSELDLPDSYSVFGMSCGSDSDSEADFGTDFGGNCEVESGADSDSGVDSESESVPESESTPELKMTPKSE